MRFPKKKEIKSNRRKLKYFSQKQYKNEKKKN